MRISTNQIYESATLNMQRNQSSVYKLQNQMSTGRRVLTPEDDPVAAAAALHLMQARAINAQHIDNQSSAGDELALVDSQLSALTASLQNVRDLVLQAGNPGLTTSDRQSIANDLEARLNEIVGIANSQNGVGDYLFSGYQGATQPFAIDSAQSALSPATISPFAYYGDDGERLLQVSASRQIAVNVSGSDVFMNVKAGNGSFVTSTGSVGITRSLDPLSGLGADGGTIVDPQKLSSALKNPLAGLPVEIEFIDATHYRINDAVGGSTAPLNYTAPMTIPIVSAGGVDFGSEVVVSGVPVAGDKLTLTPTINKGTAIANAGSVLDQQKWALAVNDAAAGRPLEIRFAVAGGVTTYGIYDPASGAMTGPFAFTPGSAIPLVTAGNVDFGAMIVVEGQPQNGDSFSVRPSGSQSVFQTLQNLVATVRAPVGSISKSEYASGLAVGLTNLDQSLANISRVQTSVGTRMREIESLTNTATDLNVQYEDSWSKLVGLDYVKAISDFSMQQTYLEAAQKSFAQISSSSLFNYL